MPVFEYKCVHCGKLEAVLHTSNPKTPVCSYCGYLMERKYSQFNNHFTPTKTKDKSNE